MEAKVSWRNLHDEGNGFSLPFSSLPSSFTFFYFIDLLMFIVLLLLQGLGFHAWRLGFHGGTSMRKVMASPFPSPPSFLFYFVFPLLIC
jgi:hypothetical protein